MAQKKKKKSNKHKNKKIVRVSFYLNKCLLSPPQNF